MTTKEVKGLREEIARLTEEQRDIYRNAKNEDRVITAEEEQRFDKIESDVAAKRSEIERIEKMLKVEQEMAQRRSESSGKDDNKDQKDSDQELYKRAFWKYASRGMGRLTADERNHLAKHFRGTAPQTTTDTAGGYTIPEDFSNELEVRLKFYGGMMEASRIYRTTNGAPLPWPTVDDTSVTGAILNEDSPSISVSDMTFGQKLLNAYTYHSNIVKVSIPLAEDSAFDLESFLMEQFSNRIGRILNTHFTTGTGSDQPNGFETAVNAASGWVDAAGSASITRGDLVDLVHGVDRAYRPGSRFMMNDNTLAAIKKLSFGSSDDRPLYLVGNPQNGTPDRLEGYAFTINNDMDDIGTGDTPVAFGDFSKYVIRMTNDMTFLRLDERYADALQIGFIAYLRADGELIQDNAIKLLKNA